MRNRLWLEITEKHFLFHPFVHCLSVHRISQFMCNFRSHNGFSNVLTEICYSITVQSLLFSRLPGNRLKCMGNLLEKQIVICMLI